MKIEILVFCYGYEKRLNWMLSSIQDCRKVSEHDIQVRVATLCEHERFKFNCLDMQHIFDFLEVTEFSNSQFKNRAMVRNHQVQNLDKSIEAILFADADHLYDPMFFDALVQKAKEVESLSDKDSNMYTVRRTSTDDLKKMDELIASYHYPMYIPNTIKLYKQMETRITSAPGAGNTQFIFAKDIKDGTYIKENEIRDRNFFRSISYQSDRTFRRKFDKVVKLDIPYNQYHLQHNRYSFDNLIQQ